MLQGVNGEHISLAKCPGSGGSTMTNFEKKQDKKGSGGEEELAMGKGKMSEE